MAQRSNLIAGVAGVMALILIMVGFYAYKHMPSNQAIVAKITPATIVAKAEPAPNALILPPPVFTKPMPRAVVSNYKPQHTVVKFSGLQEAFIGTWAAYPQLCNSAWYDISSRHISVAGAPSCDVRGVQTAMQTTSATVVLDCHRSNDESKETWNLTQPRNGVINIRPLDITASGNAVTLYRCTPPQVASN